MANNFRISELKCNDSVHLSLNGDFDGTSAHELINALKSYGTNINQVFINTNGLKRVHAFGRVVLFRNMPILNHQCGSLVFIGNHGRKLSKPWIN